MFWLPDLQAYHVSNSCRLLKITPRLIAINTKFKNAEFYGATFSDGTNFDGATFGDGANFGGATFADGVRFSRATFGDRARFSRATFGDGARFFLSTFDDGADFDGATFGNMADFEGTRFGIASDFESATFGRWAYFDQSTFGDGARFVRTTFGGGARFSRATFGDGARLDVSNVTNAAFAQVDLRRVTLDDLQFGLSSQGTSYRGRRPTRWFDWSHVRALGNLQILTRASYLSLLLVPVLAGIWPGVRIAVNRLNQAMERAAVDVDAAAEKLASKVNNIPMPGDTAKEARDRVLAKLEEIRLAAQSARDRFGPETLRTPRLPRSWLLAYLAALAVVAGHLVYQVAAPELIREQSREGLARERREGFHEERPDHKDQLNRAFDFLRQVAEVLPEERHRNFARRHGQVVWLPSELTFLSSEAQRPDPRDPSQTIPATPPDTERMRVVIDEGAKAEYDLSAHDVMNWARVAGGLYGVGASLIIWILVDQSVSIFRAANG